MSQSSAKPPKRKVKRLSLRGVALKRVPKSGHLLSADDDIVWTALKYITCSSLYKAGIASNYTEQTRPRAWKPSILVWPSYLNKSVEGGLETLLNKRFKEGVLPKAFEKYLVVKDGKNTIDVPPIRSCVKAPDGHCFVESDYQTAEVRGLAFISGDENMIRLLTEPDPQFVLTKDNKEVRVSYDENCGISDGNKNPELFFSYYENGKFIKKYSTEEMQTHIDGTLVHAKSDFHWSLVEMVKKCPRELLNRKKDRDGIGKPGNFCIAEGEPVLTDIGWLPIQKVKLYHKLWDGNHWVSHKGVVCNGHMTVRYHQGLWATDGHEVWTTIDHRKILFVDAIANNEDIKCDNLLAVLEKLGRTLPCTITLDTTQPRESKAYDIMNAGPQRRYVCSGVLVSNSTAYGASATSLERKIESDAGFKPEEGTGERILDALALRQPVAVEFLKGLETKPKDPGLLIAASGRQRHFILHPQNIEGIPARLSNGILTSMGREARNFFFQESVAAASSLAGKWLLEFAIENNLKGRIMVILYDSCVTLCPIEERQIWAKAHTLFMELKNGWWYHKRVLRYPTDNEFNIAWSAKPDKETKALLYDQTYQPTSEHLKSVEADLDTLIEYYRENELESVYNKRDIPDQYKTI